MSIAFSDHSADNVGTSTVPDRAPATPNHDKSGEPSGAADETKSNWKSTAFTTAKLLLRGVRDSADAFGPLKSVAGGLCFIVENCEVWSPSCMRCLMLTDAPANEGKYTRNRVAGPTSHSARQIALRTCFRGRCQGGIKKEGPRVVRLYFTTSRTECDIRESLGNWRMSIEN